MIELKNCPICDASEWESMDHIRDADTWRKQDIIGPADAVGFKVCKGCGFATYDYQDDVELKRRYALNRVAIGIPNLVTQNRKLEYHREMLKDIFPTMKGGFLDYGCSIGSLVVYAESYGIKSLGIELNDVDRKIATGYTGIDAVESKDGITDKFGGIAFFHVLEHLQNPDRELQWAVEHLRDDGFIYVAVPVYDETIEEASGGVCADFEQWYHLNHVNCFTYTSAQRLYSKCGLVIEKENRTAYGYAVILRKGTAPEVPPEDYREVMHRLEQQKKAIDLLAAGKHQEAVDVWPRFPDAWVHLSMKQENYFDFKSNIETLRKGIEACGEHPRLLEQLASVYLQWDEAKKGKKIYGPNTKEAERIFHHLLTLRSSENTYFFLGIIEAHYKGNPQAAKAYFEKVAAINPTKWAEMQNLILWAFQQ